MKTRTLATSLAVVLALIAGGAASASAQKYSLAAIPSPPNSSGPCQPVAVNDRGQTVGYVPTGNDPQTDLPFIYDPSAGTRVLPSFVLGAGGVALSINHAGHVVGYRWSGGFGGPVTVTGFVWDSANGTRQLDQIADSNGVTAANLGWNTTVAWNINTQGDILCGDFDAGIRIGIWRMTTTGGVSTLNVIPVPYDGLATGIIGFSTQLNDSGIVLTYQTTTSGRRPVLWDSNSGAFTEISPTLGLAVGLNNNGAAAGNGVTYDAFGNWSTTGMAWLYTGSGGVTNLGSLGGGTAYVHGINDLNQVVGYSPAPGAGAQAVIWQNGSITNLNNLTGGGRKWFLSGADAISNSANAKHTAGYIVGEGVYNGVLTAWIATPK
jgi:probable HAF family extracellular repeat protein